MKKTILIFILINLALVCNAQTFQISGTVTNMQNEPIESAEVLLLQNNSALQYQLTGEDGKFVFSFARGTYSLLIRQMGDTLHIQNINLTQNTDIGVVAVQQKTLVLQGTTVVAQKKLIEKKVDRMVFNVTNLPSTDGGNVIDILKITPGLTVSNSAIQMVGKSGLSVMINDRPVQLSSTELMNFLKGLRSSDIQNIEVITTPPAKYEAEGNSGIINIVMKKIANETWRASVFGNYDQAKYAEGVAGGSFSYRKKNLSFYANASYSGGKSYKDDESTIYYPKIKWAEKGNFINKSNSFNARTGLDIAINDNWTAGVQYLSSFSDNKQKNYSGTDLSNTVANNAAGQIITDGNGNSKSNTHSGNLYSIIKLDTLGRKISLDFDFLSYHANSDKTYKANTKGSTDIDIPNGLQSADNIVDRKITNYAMQTDVEHPVKKINLNYGIKLSFTRTDNDIQVFDLNSGTPVNNPNQTNKFLYKENTQAFYVSANTELGKWEMQLGLRGENTQFTGNSVTMDTVFKESYLEFFPTAYLTYNHNDKNTFYIEYGRRISRPSFSQLNPFRTYSNPYYYFAGNPELKPVFTTNIDLGYVYNNMFQAVLFYSKSKDNSGGGIVLLDDDAYTQIGTRLNYFDDYSMGTRIVYIFSKLKWWMSQNSVSAYYQHSDSKIYPLTPKTSEGYGAYFQASNTFYFNKNKTVSAGFDFFYMPPANSLDITHNYYRTNLTASVKMLFLNKTLSVTLSGNNLLNEYSFNWRGNRNGMLMYSKAHYDPMFFRLAVSYSFGSSKVRVQQRQVSNQEEKNRVYL